MAKNDDIEELLEWKHDQELRQATATGVKEGQWKTCTLAWSIITGFVATIAGLCVNYSEAVYAGVKAFWVVAMGKIQ